MGFQLRLADVADHVDIHGTVPANDAAVVRSFGLHADDEVHPRNIRSHFLRQSDKTEVGQAQAGFALADQIEHGLHGDIFHEQRHDAQHSGAFARHVRRDLRRHHPGIVFQTHPVMNDPADLRKRIVAQARIDLRRDIGCKVPHRPAREQAAQIDRQQDLDRLAPHTARNLFILQVADGLHHDGGNELCHADAEFLCLFLDSRDGQHERGEVQKAVRLRRSAHVVGGLLGAAGGDVARVAQEAVLQLLRVRILQAAQNAVFGGDIDLVFLAQVFRNQRFEEDQTARAVRDCVEELYGDAAAVDQHTEGAFAHVVKRDVDERIALVFFNRGSLRDLLEIVPERAPAQADGD